MYEFGNILVAGGKNGFIGSNVVDYLRKKRYRNVYPATSTRYNLLNRECTEKLFKDIKPNVVINCAGHAGGVDQHTQASLNMFWENMLIAGNLIEQSQSNNVDKFIQLGTSASYPDSAPQPLYETSLYSGEITGNMAPYGSSRLAILDMLKSSNLNWVYLIPSNVIGLRNRSGVVVSIINKIKKIASTYALPPLEVWGDGTAIRDFVDVEDLCRAIHLSLESKEDLKLPINIGSGQGINIKDLVKLICLKMKYTGSINFDATKPNGKPKYVLDINRAVTLLDWEPSIDLEESLNEILK